MCLYKSMNHGCLPNHPPGAGATLARAERNAPALGKPRFLNSTEISSESAARGKENGTRGGGARPRQRSHQVVGGTWGPGLPMGLTCQRGRGTGDRLPGAGETGTGAAKLGALTPP